MFKIGIKTLVKDVRNSISLNVIFLYPLKTSEIGFLMFLEGIEM